jgi:hypothetical protein
LKLSPTRRPSRRFRKVAKIMALDLDDTDLNIGDIDDPMPDDLHSPISDALLAWVNTFSDTTGNEAFILDDLSDGLILYDLLALLEPTHFNIDDLKKTDDDGTFTCTYILNHTY